MRKKVKWLGKLFLIVFLTIFVFGSIVSYVTAEETITLKFYTGRWMKEVKAGYRDLIELYEIQNPGIKIEVNWGGTAEAREHVLKSVIAGTLEDVFESGSGFALEFGPRGHFLDLSPYISAELYEDFTDAALEFVDGAEPPIYQLPSMMGFGVGFYNKAMIAETGARIATADDPWDWTEFAEIMQKATKDKDGNGTTDTWGFVFGTHWMWLCPTWSAGSDYFGQDPATGEWRVEFGENGRRGVQFVSDWFHKYKITPQWLIGTFNSTIVQHMIDENVAMHIQGMYVRSHWMKATSQKVFEETIGVMPWPVDKTNPDAKERLAISVAGGSGFSIAETSKYKEEAAKFVLYMLEPEHLALTAGAEWNVPTRKSALLTPQFQTEEMLWKDISALAPVMTRALPIHPTYSEFDISAVQPVFQKLVTGAISVDGAIKEMESKGNAMLDEWREKMES